MNLNFNKELTIEPGMVYVHGYFVVNGTRSEFIPRNEYMPEKQLDLLKAELMMQHFTVADLADEKQRHDINFLKTALK